MATVIMTTMMIYNGYVRVRNSRISVLYGYKVTYLFLWLRRVLRDVSVDALPA